jgi:hypothetical protein
MHERQRTVDPRYGTPGQCAAYLGASRAWFLEHVAPHLHAVLVGTRRLYSFAESDAWWAREAGVAGAAQEARNGMAEGRQGAWCDGLPIPDRCHHLAIIEGRKRTGRRHQTTPPRRAQALAPKRFPIPLRIGVEAQN